MTSDLSLRMLACVPRGEYYLYTNLNDVLAGLSSTEVATVGIAGTGSVSQVHLNPDDLSCDSLLSSWESGAAAPESYLDDLASISVADGWAVSLADGDSDVLINAPHSGCLSVARLVVSAHAGANCRLNVHSSGPGVALIQISLRLDAGADVSVFIDQPEGSKALCRAETSLAANSSLALMTESIHPRFVRNEFLVSIVGEGANLKLGGAYHVAEGEKLDNSVKVEHKVGGAVSGQLFKGIADKGGRMSFSGLIVVDKDAQKTEAFQTNRHLLMSDDARAWAKPQLEIYADDVKCSHGATTGQIDAAQLFYLMQRGIDEATAKALLADAFLAEVYNFCGIQNDSVIN